MRERLLRLPMLGLALLPFATAGCHGVLWGQLAMFAVVVGIFMGTLSLGRK